MCPAVLYIPWAPYSMEQTGDIITFANFEEGSLLSESRNDAESGDKSDEDSIMPPIITVEEIYLMDSEDEFVDEPMSTEM